MSKAWVWLLALVAPSFAAANEIRVALHPQGDAKCGAARITATADSGERREWQSAIPGTLTIDIPLNTTWVVSAAADGCWSKPVQLSAGIATSELTLRVWPVRKLRGALRFDGAAAAPSVGVRFRDDSDPEYVPARCAADEGVACDVPAGLVDVRVGAKGYGAKYIWNVDASAGDVKLDPIFLRPGSTIAGRVVAKRAAGDISVALRAVDVDPPRTVKATKTASTGWFQFDGLPAGTYSLVASKDGYAKGQVNVVLSDPRNVELSPLTLERLLTFHVTVTPPVDPSGSPWQIVLDRRPKESRYLSRIAASGADVAGRWYVGNIEPGTYVVTVLDAAKNAFQAQELEVSDSRADAFLSVSVISVVGRLSKSGKGVPAELTFNGRDRTNVVFQSSDDGTFRGSLPREGQWWVDIRRAGSEAVQRRGPIDVRRDDSGSARIDLALAEGSLRGTVVDESGHPADGAVFLYRPGKRLLEVEVQPGSGAFAFDDLDPGKVTVEARSTNGESGLVEVDVSKTGNDALALVVRKRATVSGWITTQTGYPVTGAYVRALGPTFPERREALTGPGGEFTLKVPRGTAAVTIVVLPSAGPIFLRRLPVSETRQQIVAPQQGGRLVFRGSEGWPFILGADRDPVSVVDLTYPRGVGTPREITPEGVAIEVEAGSYSVCAPPLGRGRCLPANISVGRSTTLDLRAEP